MTAPPTASGIGDWVCVGTVNNEKMKPMFSETGELQNFTCASIACKNYASENKWVYPFCEECYNPSDDDEAGGERCDNDGCEIFVCSWTYPECESCWRERED